MAYFVFPECSNNTFRINLLEELFEEVEHMPEDKNSLIRVKDFFESTIPRFTDKQFQTYFRLSRSTFEIFLQKIGQEISHDYMPADKSVLIFLKFIGTQETYESLSLIFNISKSYTWSIIQSVSRAIENSGFCTEMIRLPNTQEMELSQKEFFKLTHNSIGNCIGCIDCKEVSFYYNTYIHTYFIVPLF